MDQSAESISLLDATALGRVHRAGSRSLGVRRSQVERPVWPIRVVVVDEDAEHLFELPPPTDDEPVEALRTDGTKEAPGDGIRPRRPKRGVNGRGRVASEQLVEGARELAVGIVDQEAKGRGSLGERAGSLLGDPDAARIRGAAGEMYAPEVDAYPKLWKRMTPGVEARTPTFAQAVALNGRLGLV